MQPDMDDPSGPKGIGSTRRRPLPYNKQFNAGPERQMSDCEPQWDKPIFIVGAPRSGTTLLRNLLNRHPQIAIFRDSDFYHYVFRRSRSFGDLSDPRNRQRLVKEYLSIHSIRRAQLDTQKLEAALLREGGSYDSFFLSLLRFYARSQGKRRCGDKGHYGLFTEALCEWYPGATIIHLVRDPRDVVASLLCLKWADQNVLGNARLWLRCNLAARRSLHRPQYLLVRYEQLVTQPQQELRRICGFAGEEYSDAMLVPNHDPTADRPWFQRAEEPVTTERLGKWRSQLTADQVALIEWLVKPHMQTFGYEPAGASPKTLTVAGGLASAAYDAARRRAGEFPRIWYSLTWSTHLAKEEAAKERFRNGRLTAAVTPEKHP
jgi:hypothetical protein